MEVAGGVTLVAAVVTALAAGAVAAYEVALVGVAQEEAQGRARFRHQTGVEAHCPTFQSTKVDRQALSKNGARMVKLWRSRCLCR